MKVNIHVACLGQFANINNIAIAGLLCHYHIFVGRRQIFGPLLYSIFSVKCSQPCSVLSYRLIFHALRSPTKDKHCIMKWENDDFLQLCISMCMYI